MAAIEGWFCGHVTLGTLVFVTFCDIGDRREQAGFGMESSSPKADIYGLGILMNVMVTGCVPKQRKASGKIWEIIERCVKMDPGDRPDAWELSDILRKNAGGSNAR